MDAPRIKWFVIFYFTNFPMHAPNFILRQGFEVCCILDEVFVPNKQNVNSEAYGFVRYSNVRDVDKLLRDVNGIFFGHMRVHATLTRFHKVTPKGTIREGEGGLVKDDGVKGKNVISVAMWKGLDGEGEKRESLGMKDVTGVRKEGELLRWGKR